VAVFFVLGLMFQFTKNAANFFIALHYPLNQSEVNSPDDTIMHHVGPSDISTLIFYTTLIIVWHAALQEYIFDKCVRRLNLSKTRTSKFSEHGQLFAWFACNAIWGSNLCFNLGFFSSPRKLSDDWPHDLIPWEAKLFYIFQLSFWIHQYPELYLQRIRGDDMANRISYSTVYLVVTALPYSMGFWKSGLMLLNLHYVGEAFSCFQSLAVSIPALDNVYEVLSSVASGVYISVRVVSLALGLMTFHLGFAHQPNTQWNQPYVRTPLLLIVSLLQIYQMWHFLGKGVRKWRENKKLKKDD